MSLSLIDDELKEHNSYPDKRQADPLTEKQNDRKIKKQTDRQTDRKKDRQ